MEDALVQEQKNAFLRKFGCLNPCFNGRCTRTKTNALVKSIREVLILVLMEDALVRMVFILM